ncbi:MAG: CNNM domain-containing protein [Betaproteobacteria bacterium]|nr:CNNM domain-containing protein [Betaproteobacteria bacterium]
MDFNINFQLSLLAVLLILSAFFAISETSLMSVNRYRLKHMSKEGNVGAKLALKLLNETDKLLSVILLCNNFANAAAAALVTLIVVEFFGTQESIIFVGTLVTTFMIVIFSEISPKVIGAAHPEKLAPFCSYILYPLLRIFYPIVLFLNFFVLGFLKLVNIKTNFNQNDLINMDELKSIISESGTFIPQKNKSIFLNLIDLNKVTIDEVMMPHTSVEAVHIKQSIDEILEKVINSNYRQMVVKDSDEILGVIDSKKILNLFIKEEKDEITHKKLMELIEPPYFIPSGTTIYKQIQYFQDNQEKKGFIVNEHGDFLGLVSLEDLLEEIIGEFNTDIPSKLSKIITEDDGWIIDGGISIRDLNKKLNLKLPTDGPVTISGLIIEFLENIPDTNTSFKMHKTRFEIINIYEQTIKKVKIYK